MRKADTGKVKVVRDDAPIVAVDNAALGNLHESKMCGPNHASFIPNSAIRINRPTQRVVFESVHSLIYGRLIEFSKLSKNLMNLNI